MRRVLGGVAVVVLVTAAVVAGALAPRGHASAEATTKIKVTASEFKFVLSKKTAPKGTIVFTLVNKGKLPHDFKIAGRKTPKIGPGKTTTLKVTIAAKGKRAYVCTIPGHALAGMKGTFTVS
jgi:uncharacterized cupredoxin-like copper-binding protein